MLSTETIYCKPIDLYKNNSWIETLINIPNSGASTARNKGFELASGEVIFFAEADAYYANDYIELCVNRLLSDPALGTVIGTVHAWQDGTLLSKYWEQKRRLISQNYKPISGWFFRRKDLQRIGLYREDLEVGEDIELCDRLRREGLKLRYEPNAKWWHRYPTDIKTIAKKSFKRGLKARHYYKKISKTPMKEIFFFVHIHGSVYHLIFIAHIQLYFITSPYPIDSHRASHLCFNRSIK